MTGKSYPSRPALVAALILAVACLAALAVQANAGPFDGSSVVPTPVEVNVGDMVGFAIYLVNSDTATATNVLVWNPLPAGATFVAASGGAFPVVGNLDATALSSRGVAEGLAYDVQHRQAIPMDGLDPGTVTGIAWTGDISPGEMVTLGLIVTVDNPARRFLVDELFIYDDRELAGQFSGQAWVLPHELFLPLTHDRFKAPIPTPTPVPAATTTMTFTIPYGQGLGFGGGSLHPDYEQALAGADLRFGDEDVYLGQAPPSGPYLPWYVVGRAYGGWDTAALPDGTTILSATLLLEVGCNPPSTTFGTTVYRGLWAPPLAADAWYAMGHEIVGAWDTADYPCGACPSPHPCLVQIEIEPSVVNRQGLTLLEVRSDREGAPPTTPEQVLLNRSAGLPALVITYREEP